MNTQVKENGQAKGADLKADKSPKFVAGNPVNAVAKKAEESKKAEPGAKAAEVKTEQVKPQAEAVQPEAPKFSLNLDQTLKLVADLAKKTALRDRYIGYIDDLASFQQGQKDELDELEDEAAFMQCELQIRDHLGNVFTTKSPSVIKGTVAFISGRFAERLAEVEAGIILPA